MTVKKPKTKPATVKIKVKGSLTQVKNVLSKIVKK